MSQPHGDNVGEHADTHRHVHVDFFDGAELHLARTGSARTAAELQMERTESMRGAVQNYSAFRELILVFVTCMSQFLTQSGIGICLSPLDIMGDSFGITNPGTLSWLIAGYSLTVGTFILFSGRLGDLLGYREMYVFGWVWYAVWSLVAGVSVYSNSVLFIFARTLQGIGPAVLLPNGLAILGATYPPSRKKSMIFALFGATAPNGAVCGATFAALFSQLAWWPWTFFTLAIYCAILAAVSAWVVPPSPKGQQHPLHDAGGGLSGFVRLVVIEMDFVGAALGIGGLVLINVAWNQAPIVGWQEAYVYVLLIIGFVVLALFFVYEIHVASRPLIPFQALNSNVSFILGCIACGWGSFGIWIYYTWRLIEKVRLATPLLGCAEFTPPCVAGIVAAFLTGYLMHKVNPSWIMLVAMMAFTTGNALSSIMPVHQTYWALTFVTLIITPFGMDMSFPAATLILSNSVPREHQGIAASLVTTVVNYSISICLGLGGTVEVHVNNGGHTFHDMLKGYRGALYMGIGIGGLGVATSLVYLLMHLHRSDGNDGQSDANRSGNAVANGSGEGDLEYGVKKEDDGSNIEPMKEGGEGDEEEERRKAA